MNENELTEALNSAAREVVVRSDLGEVEMRSAQVRGRRRVATGVAAAMLIAGAGGLGFGIGRSASNDGQISGVAAEVDDTTSAGPSESADTFEAPNGAAPADPSSNASGDAAPPPPASVAEDAGQSSAVEVAGDIARSSEYYPGGYQQAMNLIYTRNLPDGLRIRVSQGQSWANYEEWPDDAFQPASFCWGTAELRITFDSETLVDISSASYYESLFGAADIQMVAVGWADGRPLRAVTVQAPGATQATITWDDGLVDTTEIVAGIAVLVVDGDDPWNHTYSVDILGADGATTSYTPESFNYWDDPAWRAACQEPPPALPDAGEQPANPEVARAAIETNFALLWDQSVDQTDKVAILDDWTGVAEARDQMQAGEFADVAGNATLTIDELVFTSPTEAWFRYSISSDISNFYDRYGTANLVGDAWQFPRALICQDLGLAGGGCDPWVDNIYPPSWYERYGNECWVDDDGTESCERMAVPEPMAEPAVTVAPTPEG